MIWRKLLQLVRNHNITVDHVDFPFDRSAEAWALQAAGPHAKITSRINP
jgi:hypothetical protein